jgi:hypothetical protein
MNAWPKGIPPNPEGRGRRKGDSSFWARMDDDARLKWIYERRKAGVRSEALAIEGGTYRKTIDGWLKARGIKLVDIPVGTAVGARWVKMAEPERRETLLAAIQAGHRGYAALSRALECGDGAVRDYVLAHGIFVPPAKLGQPIKPKPGNARPVGPPAVFKSDIQNPVDTLKGRTENREFPHRVHMLDSTRAQCKYPLWGHKDRPTLTNMFYCGAPIDETVDKTSYCPECRTIIRKAQFSAADREEMHTRMALMRRSLMRQPRP